MHEGPGYLRAEMAEVVRESGAEVPCAAWPAAAARVLRKAWKWNDLYWIEHNEHGFYGPYDALSDVEPEWFEGQQPRQIDEAFDEAMQCAVNGRTVFSHAQTRGGCGSSESVEEWGGLYWSSSCDYGLNGPSATVEGALGSEALCITGATSSIWCSEMTAEEIISLLNVYCDEVYEPFTINDEYYVVRGGRIVPYIESEDDDDEEIPYPCAPAPANGVAPG